MSKKHKKTNKTENKSNSKIIVSILAILLVGGIVLSIIHFTHNPNSEMNLDQAGSVSLSANKVTVYKSPSCGCCSGYIKELKRKGYDVEVIEETNMNKIKIEHNIPDNMQSCHTSLFGDYVVEGHVPLEAVEKLLAEQPEIDGIALPGMPQGSIGMPGRKMAPFNVYSLKDGKSESYITI